MNLAELKKYFSNLTIVAEEENVQDGRMMAAAAYQQGNLSLVLGAGVAVDYGVPDWNSILQELLIKIEDFQESDEVSRSVASMFTSAFRPNNLISGRFLQNHYRASHGDDDLAFEEAVRAVLYKKIATSATELVKEVRNFCIAPGRSPNLRCIVTYNFDDIIENDLRTCGTTLRYKSVFSPGMHAANDELAIYHVHGFLPRSGVLDARNKVVLSEDIYHQRYSNVYDWSNLVQINTFKDSNCVFVGSSLTDPNQRRLLDISKEWRGDSHTHHFLIKKRYDPKQVLRNLKEDLSSPDAKSASPDIVNGLVRMMHDFEERDAKSFGVQVIWINEYKEASEVLSDIRSGKV